MNRLFIAREAQHVESMIAFIRQNWAAMAQDGQPMAGRFSVYRKDRVAEQNDLMWRWLRQIEQHGWIGGRQYKADPVWHELAKRELLPESCAKIPQKWATLPSGDQVLMMGTSDLNTKEMSDYLDRLGAWAANDLGIELQ